MKARYPVRPRTADYVKNPGEGDGGGEVLFPAEYKDDDEELDIKRKSKKKLEKCMVPRYRRHRHWKK